MTDAIIRAAKPSDEPAILELASAEMEAHALLDPRFRLRPDSAARYATYLRNRMREIDSSVFVATSGEEIAGLVVASIRIQEAFFEPRRFGYVSDLVVAPPYRRQGIGRQLWERAQLWFKGLGVGVIRLHIAATSEPAMAFWKAVGGEPLLVETWIDLPHDAVAPSEPPTAAGADDAGGAG